MLGFKSLALACHAYYLRHLHDRPFLRVSVLFLLAALLSLPFADLSLYPSEPWQELRRIFTGFVTPQWHNWSTLGNALLHTIAFAFIAILTSVVAGLLLSTLFAHRSVRVFSASIRAVHELFWGLILMQTFGLSAVTGILAIAIPYTGIFAKIFSETFDRQSSLPSLTLESKKGISQWFYTLFAQSLPELTTYVRYRFECALRSSAILGFIGLPTLGFYFESAFKQGQYSEAACVLWVFFGLIASIRYWLKWPLIPFYSVTAWFWLPDSPPVYGSYFWQFISHDIWPAPLLEGKLFAAAQWYGTQLFELLIPAAGYTLVLSLLALVLTGLLALILFPLASKPIVGRANIAGYGLLLLLRSTPEIVIAFILLLVFGPSGLPAILALAIHNSGLIGYIIARQSEQLPLRADHPKNVNLYSFEIVPRIFPQLLTLLLYRWEVIMRESAILGLLGVTTLGFYIDSAFEEIRYDKAFLLVIVAALMNIGVDMAARRIRTSAGISNANLSASTQTATPKAT